MEKLLRALTSDPKNDVRSASILLAGFAIADLVLLVQGGWIALVGVVPTIMTYDLIRDLLDYRQKHDVRWPLRPGPSKPKLRYMGGAWVKR